MGTFVNKKKLWLDKLGICLSVCCGVHCLATVLFLAIGTTEIWYFIENEQVENLMSIGVLLIGIFALFPSLIAHRSYGLIGLFTLGFVVLKTSELISNIYMKSALLTIGVLLIIGTHYLNIKNKKEHARTIETKKEASGHSA